MPKPRTYMEKMLFRKFPIGKPIPITSFKQEVCNIRFTTEDCDAILRRMLNLNVARRTGKSAIIILDQQGVF